MFQNSLLVTKIQHFEENIRLILCHIKLFERYEQYEKKFINITILSIFNGQPGIMYTLSL